MALPADLMDKLRTAGFRRRFYDKTEDAADGCHRWIGAVSSNGYGMIAVCGQVIGAHRVAWMLQSNELIPDGLTIDHLCQNTLCVNAEHLEVVEFAENYQRMLAAKGWGFGVPNVRERYWPKTNTTSYQVLWRERQDGKLKQRGRSFPTMEAAEQFMAYLNELLEQAS